MTNLALHAAGRRRGVVVALAALAVSGLLAACASKPTVNVSASQPLSANAVDAGITVTGSGEVAGTPDTLTASFGVLTVRPSVSEAVAANAVVAHTVSATFRARKVLAADIQTQNYSVFPSFITVHDRTVPNGYTVGETMVVELHDLATAGATIDAAIAAGGTSISVQGVTFTLEHNQQLLARARAKAWSDAQSQARQLASLSGRPLGATQGISVNVSPSIYDGTSQFKLAQAASAPSTPIQPGQVSTSVTITVRFALR
jgi:uncharacterized protein YggE